MEPNLIVVVVILLLVILILLVKIRMLQKSAREIETAFAERLDMDTNTLIDISSRDRHMRSLANALNDELRKLRAQRQRFCQGDRELKNAVTNISHDLRTPLTAICSYLDLLEQEEKSDTVARYIEVIRNRAETMEQLTDELFRYSIVLSVPSDGARESVVLNEVLEDSIAASYALLSERGITPNIVIPEEKIIRTLDRSALMRIFSNLLNNAAKYSDGDLDIELKKNGEMLFCNTASNLNEVQVEKLFDRFYTVESARKSTGLGLSIARTLTEQMGGIITARYEEGRLVICLTFKE